MVALPAELLQAVSAAGGGRITLVLGAGCSFEAPTAIPLAGTCSQQCHDRLVANGTLAPGDCGAPSNLSALADAVFQKAGSQRPLVDLLAQLYAFKTATPNEGYLLAAALLAEGAIVSIITLNFDLALSTAIAELGVGDTVAIVDGPDDLPHQRTINVYYLHRNVTAIDPETWILPTQPLTNEWRGHWEGVVAAKVLATPVIVFAGLGSPADVLIESTKLIRRAIPNGNRSYQVDPGAHDQSEFFRALELDASDFIRAPWCDFMAALSQRLVLEQTTNLAASAAALVQREHMPPEDLSQLLGRLQDIGLLQLGRLRSNWLLHEKPYYPDHPATRDLVADLLLAAAMLSRISGATAVPFEDGTVEFRRGDRTVASHLLVSGRGLRSIIAIEGELSARQRRLRGRATPPTGAIVAATSAYPNPAVSTPASVILGDTSDSILLGQPPPPILHVAWLREDPSRCAQVIP